MQTLKFLQNKMGLGSGDGTEDLAIEIDGKPFTKRQLLEAKQVRLDELARERDPQKIDELTCLLAQLESAIKSFEPIAEIKEQARRRKEELRRLDMEALSAGQRQFSEEIGVITGKIMERDVPESSCDAYTEREPYWDKRARQVYSFLYASLTFEQATAQFHEICEASREKRSWLELTDLPKVVRSGEKVEVHLINPSIFEKLKEKAKQFV
jgi:hypothetical protein